MSSILKALRQLERETAASSAEPLTPLEPERGSDSLPPSARRRRRQRRIRLGAGAVAVGAAVVLGVFWAAALDRPDAADALPRAIGAPEDLSPGSSPLPAPGPPPVAPAVAAPEFPVRVVAEPPPVAPAVAAPEPPVRVVAEPPPAREVPRSRAPSIGEASSPRAAKTVDNAAVPARAQETGVAPEPAVLPASPASAIVAAPPSPRVAASEPDRPAQPLAAPAIRQPDESVEPAESQSESEPSVAKTPLPGLESTRWHPAPELREARIVVAGRTLVVGQADLVSGYHVVEITPSAIVFGRDDETFRVRVGSR